MLLTFNFLNKQKAAHILIGAWCLTLISCGFPTGTYQFRTTPGTHRAAVTSQQQVDQLLNRIVHPQSQGSTQGRPSQIGQALKLFYDQNKDHIQIEITQSTVPQGSRTNNTTSRGTSRTSETSPQSISNALDFISHSDLEVNLMNNPDGRLKCSIEINGQLEENTQAHLLAHQLERCRAEMNIYSAFTNHPSIDPLQVIDFYALKESNGTTTQNSNLEPLMIDLEAYSKFQALLINNTLKTEGLTLDIDLEDDNVLADAVLDDLTDKGLDAQKTPDELIVMARGRIMDIINNFFASLNLDPRDPPSDVQAENSSSDFDDYYYPVGGD